MYTFEEQEKMFAKLLNKESNRKCADCNSIHPTWASLDFGVFVCSNCSGAHRALGPTITRVKSTTLDLWARSWAQNMQIGNRQINQYWEADIQSANIRRPKLGASLEDHDRYIRQKYRKKKYVKQSSAMDPLTAYKNGTYNNDKYAQQVSSIVPQPPSAKKKTPIVVQSKPELKKKVEVHTKSETFNLLDDLQNNDIIAETNKATVKQSFSNKQQPDDQFSQFIEAQVIKPGYQQMQKQNSVAQNRNMTFQDLMKAPNLATHHSQPHSNHHNQNNMQNHNQNNMQNHNFNNNHSSNPHMIHNSFATQSQNLYNNYHHNPYVGYVPHYTHPNNFQGQQQYAGNPNQMNYQGYQGGYNQQLNTGQFQGNQGINRPSSYQANPSPSNGIQGFTL